MYKLFLSFRYFRSRPINIIPVLCTTLGVAALIVILAVMDGFQHQLKKTLRGNLSDIIIRVNYESDFEKWEKVLTETDGVEAVAPHLQSFALVAETRENVRAGAPRTPVKMDGALVLGIDADRESEVSSFREYLLWRVKGLRKEEWVSSTPDPERPFTTFGVRYEDRPGVILGRQLAVRLKVRPPRLEVADSGKVRWVYDRVLLTTMVRGKGEQKFRAREWDFCVTGIYESGSHEIDQHIAYIDRRVAKEFFELSRDPEEIRVQLTDYARHEEVIAGLYTRRKAIFAETTARPMPWLEAFSPFVIDTWEDRRRNFLNAIENEKGLIAIIAGMAFIVTGFMIFSILSMVVTMKTRDIGILKALGGTTRGILSIFILNGIVVGIIGSFAGLGLGLLFTDNINWVRERLRDLFGWEPFPADIYLFSEIPTRVIPEEVAMVTVMAMIVALIGAILPALRASRFDPVKALRYE
jgi:lipoprotein-releasing system permease protein